MTLREQILDRITRYGDASFAEISRMEGVDGGDFAIITPIPNVILWAGLSEQAADVITGMLDAREIHAVPTSILVYLAAGAALRFPIAKRASGYKKTHWLPTVLHLGPPPKPPKPRRPKAAKA